MSHISKDRRGFTIIEVLIVLAIAGLILLIVFLAVPALQRNSRNTQRSNDVSRALGAAQEVLNNNKNNMSALDSTALQNAIGTPAYYSPVTTITVSTTAAAATGSNATTIDSVTIYKGAECAANGLAVPGSARELVAVYTVEGGSGDVKRCTQS